ncbi:multidrug efflux system outer membrane protein [Humitalea rosea]|uniref:Multidrug efflux system outer membrane protein n=1 Tax=Humitalea rosea TaxID=990373 RepID=A0A2W7IXI3_9PROT|nr:efflux transporter outer membrane subunit [Humitalea rosea]PZW50895.1 multidrug efflux system outer membrane protein [Humitalea rosea]
MRPTLPLLAGLLLAGCSLAPDYLRPAAPIPAAWPGGPAYREAGLTPVAAGDAAQLSADAIGWRDFMHDPRLQSLVEIALANNRDLRVAALNVQGAEAQFRATRAELFPWVDGQGSLTTQRTPSDLSSAGANRGNAGINSRSYGANVGFTSFEIDLFGRLRNLSEAAFQSYLGYAETRRSAQISLVAQVATAYLAVLADAELLDLTRQTLASQESSLSVTRASVEGGATDALALRQAETSVQTARANLAAYTRQAAQDENALALLLGQPVPPDLLAGGRLAMAALLADLPVGLPSEVLLRRPDVQAAEHSLIAANANIGAARAAFFPSLSLTGSIGTASSSLSGLFAAGSAAWAFAPALSVPIFNAGSNQANLDLAKVQSNIYVARYEAAIQTAFREVADALAARGTYDDQIVAQQALTDAYADSYRLSELRFRGGVDNYLTTLDAQRSLYAAQQQLITLHQARLVNLVTLYKVLGGGWTDHAPEIATAAR